MINHVYKIVYLDMIVSTINVDLDFECLISIHDIVVWIVREMFSIQYSIDGDFGVIRQILSRTLHWNINVNVHTHSEVPIFFPKFIQFIRKY